MSDSDRLARSMETEVDQEALEELASVLEKYNLTVDHKDGWMRVMRNERVIKHVTFSWLAAHFLIK